MDNREKLIKKLGFDYIDYAIDESTENCGANGNAFEMLVKMEMKNYNFKGIAKAGKFDTTKTIDGEKLRFECKTGSGEIAHLSRQGVVKNSPTLRSDYIIYCLKFKADEPLTSQEIFVIETSEFIARASENKLTRIKMTTKMKNSDRPDELKFKDVWSLSTDGTSRGNKMISLMYELIDEGYGMTFNELLEMIGQLIRGSRKASPPTKKDWRNKNVIHRMQ